MFNQLASQLDLRNHSVREHESQMKPVTTNRIELLTTTKKRTRKESIDKWINVNDVQKAMLLFRAISHKVRRGIMDLLDENGTMTVTGIYVGMRIDQSVASQHLRILRKAEVVMTKKEGKFIYYSLNENRLNQLAKLISM